MIRVTLDSNIYISALLFGGPPDDILKLAEDGEIHVSVSDAILEEVARVLRDKFGTPPDELAVAMARIREMTDKVSPTQTVDAVPQDPSDNAIIECAQEGRSEFLVTRDNHLLNLRNFGPTKIILASEFLQTFRQRGRERQ